MLHFELLANGDTQAQTVEYLNDPFIMCNLDKSNYNFSVWIVCKKAAALHPNENSTFIVFGNESAQENMKIECKFCHFIYSDFTAMWQQQQQQKKEFTFTKLLISNMWWYSISFSLPLSLFVIIIIIIHISKFPFKFANFCVKVEMNFIEIYQIFSAWQQHLIWRNEYLLLFILWSSHDKTAPRDNRIIFFYKQLVSGIIWDQFELWRVRVKCPWNTTKKVAANISSDIDMNTHFHAQKQAFRIEWKSRALASERKNMRVLR